MTPHSLIRSAPFAEIAIAATLVYLFARGDAAASNATTLSVAIVVSFCLSVHLFWDIYFDPLPEKYRAPLLPLFAWSAFVVVFMHYLPQIV